MLKVDLLRSTSLLPKIPSQPPISAASRFGLRSYFTLLVCQEPKSERTESQLRSGSEKTRFLVAENNEKPNSTSLYPTLSLFSVALIRPGYQGPGDKIEDLMGRF